MAGSTKIDVRVFACCQGRVACRAYHRSSWHRQCPRGVFPPHDGPRAQYAWSGCRKK
jgi:hypothetical protein